MARYVAKQIVLLRFPFSDLSSEKVRPAIVITELPRDDYITCMITTRQNIDRFCIELSDADCVAGSIRHPSFIRCERLFVANETVIQKSVGEISRIKFEQVIGTIIKELLGRN